MTCDGSSSQELLASKYLWQFNVLRITVITEIKIPVTVQVHKNYWILRSKYLWQFNFSRIIDVKIPVTVQVINSY